MPHGYKPIELGDKDAFDKCFTKHPPEISEYTFTNLYMWRNYYQFSWKEVDHCICIVSRKDPKKPVFFPPVGDDPARVLPSLTSELKTEGVKVECHRVPEKLAMEVKASQPAVEMSDDRDNWDYVHLRTDLVNLEGSKFSDFRKKLSRFNRDHDVEYRKMDTDTVHKCLEMQEEWCDMRACKESPGLFVENDAIRDAFEHWDVLGFAGCIMLEDDRIIGYTLGEMLNPTTMVCHVEKANPKPVYFGAYQAIAKHFAENCSKDYEFVNREQDLGEPGLRRSKEGYNPHHMIKKFKIKFP